MICVPVIKVRKFFDDNPVVSVNGRFDIALDVGLREKSDTGKERHGEIKQL
jgi:hypothetical protein